MYCCFFLGGGMEREEYWDLEGAVLFCFRFREWGFWILG